MKHRDQPRAVSMLPEQIRRLVWPVCRAGGRTLSRLALAAAVVIPFWAGWTANADGRWDERFGLPFLDGSISAIAAEGSGSVLVGGAFTLAAGTSEELGGTRVNRLFRWGNGGLETFGTGLNGTVHAIAVTANAIYAGGEFTEAGGISASRVARWNGTEWEPLGSGVSGVVRSIVVDGNDVYVGGDFATAGGVTVNGVARWNGSQWSALGGGVGASGSVRAMTMLEGNLHVGGTFFLIQNIGGQISLITYLARWDGVAWSGLGSGVNNQVNALFADGSSLYVGGTFTTAGGNPANKVARWQGGTWSALGTGLSTGILDAANSFARVGESLYVGGSFTTAGGDSANSLARWEGGAWSAVSTGVINSIGGFVLGPGVVSALAAVNDRLHVGGTFSQAGNLTVANFVALDTSVPQPRWLAPGLGVAGPVYAVVKEASGPGILVGGFFPSAGGVAANSIGQWTGTGWEPLGGGVRQGAQHGQVYAIVVQGTNVFAAGVFNQAGEANALNIARWDGIAWSALGTGLGGNGAVVRALAITADGSLYAAGFFSTAGGQPVNRIARWDGTAWTALGSGITSTAGSAEVRALAALGNDLYVGGAFNQAGGISATGIAKWNGAAWSSVGGGMNNTVLALAAAGDSIYAGGYFTMAGTLPAARIARWDGAAWHSLGSGLGTLATDFVHALASAGAQVVAGGVFTATGGGTTVSNVAVWNGDSWSGLGTGTSAGSPPAVYGVAVTEESIHVGGTFARAGGLPSHGFAIWHASAGAPPQLEVGIANGRPVIRFFAASGQNYQVWATDNLNNAFAPLSPILPGADQLIVYEDESPLAERRFYQARILP